MTCGADVVPFDVIDGASMFADCSTTGCCCTGGFVDSRRVLPVNEFFPQLQPIFVTSKRRDDRRKHQCHKEAHNRAERDAAIEQAARAVRKPQISEQDRPPVALAFSAHMQPASGARQPRVY